MTKTLILVSSQATPAHQQSSKDLLFHQCVADSVFYFFSVLGRISLLSCALTKEDQGRVTLRETEATTFKGSQNCFVSNTFFITMSKILTIVIHPLNSMSPAVL